MAPIFIIDGLVILFMVVNFVICPLVREWEIRKAHEEEIKSVYEWCGSKEEAELIIKDLKKEWRKKL